LPSPASPLSLTRPERQPQLVSAESRPSPYRAAAVERALGGHALTMETVATAALAAAEGVDPLGDIHASAEFRAHLAQVNTRRCAGIGLEPHLSRASPPEPLAYPMKLSTTHHIKAKRAKVYAAITDPAVLQQCIEGCERDLESLI